MNTVARKGQVREVRFEDSLWVGVDVHKNSMGVGGRGSGGLSLIVTRPRVSQHKKTGQGR